MTAEERTRLKTVIISGLEETQREIAELETQLEPVAPDCSPGRLTRMKVMGEREVCAKALEEAKRRLNRPGFALGRIDHEDFGICEVCEAPIALARLRIVPESTLCVACANRQGR